MTLLVAPEKITAWHRERRAYVYVRQSTLKQVQRNRESQANQYALVERALELGWPAERVQVIDADQGTSGEDRQRDGFQELAAAVSLGHAGLILAYEASRLARNNADWYRLIELAALDGTLLADADGVYDPRAYNDRLLLGLRGMLSEAELHLLRLRLDAGRLRQVERGTYRQRLPTGLVRLPDGRVVKDPDQQVQRTLALVFARFRTLRSCQKVLRSLRDDGALLPRYQPAGLEAGRLLWKRPSETVVYELLRNPAYAGAFVYGRHGPHPARRPGQRTRMVNRRPEEWSFIHRDAYPGFISWEEFVANQVQLADNALRYPHRSRGAPREGVALLVGLVVCAGCGRQMHVAYKPQPRYLCQALTKAYGGPACLHLDAASIDTAVVDVFFQALQPAELDVLEEVLAEQRANQDQLTQQYADQVARATYEARVAQRQYEAVDPDNRLVAAELERRWELALRALAEAREAAERFTQQPPAPSLDPTLRAQFQDLGQHLPALWGSGRLSTVQKKELLRSLIRRVILARPRPETIEVKVVWVSGAFSALVVQPVLHRSQDLGSYARMVQRIVVLAAEGYQDEVIAQQLTEEGFRSARHPRGVPAVLVGDLRRAHQQPSLTEQLRRQPKFAGQWTVCGLARALSVPRTWLYTRIRRGTLPATQHPHTGHYLIPDDPQLLAALHQQASAYRRLGAAVGSSSAPSPTSLSEAEAV